MRSAWPSRPPDEPRSASSDGADSELSQIEYVKMNDRESHVYSCQNAGCISVFESNGDREFEAAPPEWYEDRDMSLPSNCPECRRWNDAQKKIGPIMARCHYCKREWAIEASYRIIFNKKMGNWDNHFSQNKERMICMRCEKNPYRVRQWTIDNIRRRYKKNPSKFKAEMDKEAAVLPQLQLETRGSNPERLNVVEYPEFYQLYPDKKHPNRLAHIMKRGHEHEKYLGTADPRTILKMANSIATSTENEVLQFRDKITGHTVKYDTRTSIVVIIDPKDYRQKLQQHVIETAYYVSGRAGAVLNKVNKKHWIPA